MSKVRNFVLGLGIVIIFALVLWQGIEAFYPSPSYDQFCGNVTVPQMPVNKTVSQNQAFCVANNGTWENGYCNYYEKCSAEFDAESNHHAQVSFYISLIVGVIALIVGYLILTVEPVGTALMASGIWSFFFGAVVNWTNISSIWRFVLLIIVLALLVWIALRLNKGKKSKGFFRDLIKRFD